MFSSHILPLLPGILQYAAYRGADNVYSTEFSLDFFISLLENLSQLLSKDNKLLKTYLKNMEEQGLLTNLVGVIGGAPSLAAKVFRLLKTICGSSSCLTISMLQIGICDILKENLDQGYDKDYFVEVLMLIDSIIPQDITKDTAEKEKAYIFRKHTRYIRNIGESLLTSLILAYETCLNNDEEILIVNVILKIFLLAPSDFLMVFTTPQNTASFISEVLHSNYSNVVLSGLKIVHICNEKIPHEIYEFLIREGVIDRINILQTAGNLKSPMAFKKRTIDNDLSLMYHRKQTRAESDPGHYIPKIKSSSDVFNHKNEIKHECASFLTKTSNFESKKTVKIGRELIKLSEKLMRRETAQDIWVSLIGMLESETPPSNYEFSSSGLVESI